jgi:hypothetical protein
MGKARRDGTDAGAISSIVIPRPFEEVLMECKDAKGVQKFIAVPSTMQWNELLQVALLVQKYLLARTKVQILTQLCYCRSYGTSTAGPSPLCTRQTRSPTLSRTSAT